MGRLVIVVAVVLWAAPTASPQFRFRGGFSGGVRISPGFPAHFRVGHPFGFPRGFFHPLPFHRGFFFGFRTFGSPHGFGNVVFPGVGHAPPLVPFTGFFGVRRFFPAFPGWWGPVLYPVPYPVGALGYAPSPPVVVVVQAAPSESEVRAPVVIRQQFGGAPEAATEPKEQEPRPAPQRKDPNGSPPGYQYLAFRTSAVKRVTALSAEGETVRYRTLEGREEQAPLAAVDRDLTAQLNEEIGAPLPLLVVRH